MQVSRATIHRILVRAGAVVSDPGKRPRSSYLRFAAEQPNECWQSDFTHYQLSLPGGAGRDVEIITWLDDHARYALSVTAHVRITGAIVVTGFQEAVTQHGIPASTLTDNGMVYTTRLSGGKGDRNQFETELRTLHRCTPATAYTTRTKATPTATGTDRTTDTHDRVRTDRVDDAGSVTLRRAGRLHHIGIGRTHARTRILLLVQDLHIRVVNAATGELLRELTLDPTKDYQPRGLPPGPTRKHS